MELALFILTTIVEIVMIAWYVHSLLLWIRRRMTRQVAIDSITLDTQSIATRLDELEESIHALRFDCARFFNANVVDSSLVVRSLMIEPPTE